MAKRSGCITFENTSTERFNCDVQQERAKKYAHAAHVWEQCSRALLAIYTQRKYIFVFIPFLTCVGRFQ